VRGATGLHPNDSRFELSHEVEKLRSGYCLAQNHMPSFIGAVNLKYVLSEVDSDKLDVHGELLHERG
jgi:hypothetical protein